MATAYRSDEDFDTPDAVHAELGARVAQLARDHALLSVGELGRRSDALRAQAGRHGFLALARLAGGLSDSLAAHGRAATVRAYLDHMDDALRCSRDGTAGDALLAAVSVRLA